MLLLFCFFFFFFFNDTATTEIYTLSLHDALPISERVDRHDVYFAPVAHGADAHLPRAALQDVHVLVAVGPRRPVVRDEVGECDTIATDMAVTDGRDVHDRDRKSVV